METLGLHLPHARPFPLPISQLSVVLACNMLQHANKFCRHLDPMQLSCLLKPPRSGCAADSNASVYAYVQVQSQHTYEAHQAKTDCILFLICSLAPLIPFSSGKAVMHGLAATAMPALLMLHHRLCIQELCFPQLSMTVCCTDS